MCDDTVDLGGCEISESHQMWDRHGGCGTRMQIQSPESGFGGIKGCKDESVTIHSD